MRIRRRCLQVAVAVGYEVVTQEAVPRIAASDGACRHAWGSFSRANRGRGLDSVGLEHERVHGVLKFRSFRLGRFGLSSIFNQIAPNNERSTKRLRLHHDYEAA